MPRNKKPNRKHHNRKPSNGMASVPSLVLKNLAGSTISMVNGFSPQAMLASLQEEMDYPTQQRNDFAPALQDGRLIAFPAGVASQVFGMQVDGAVSERCYQQVFEGVESPVEQARVWLGLLAAAVAWLAAVPSGAVYVYGGIPRPGGAISGMVPACIHHLRWEGKERIIVCDPEEELDDIYRQGQPGTRQYEARQARRTAEALAKSLNATEEPVNTRRSRV